MDTSSCNASDLWTGDGGTHPASQADVSAGRLVTSSIPRRDPGKGCALDYRPAPVSLPSPAGRVGRQRLHCRHPGRGDSSPGHDPTRPSSRYATAWWWPTSLSGSIVPRSPTWTRGPRRVAVPPGSYDLQFTTWTSGESGDLATWHLPDVTVTDDTVVRLEPPDGPGDRSTWWQGRSANGASDVPELLTLRGSRPRRAATGRRRAAGTSDGLQPTARAGNRSLRRRNRTARELQAEPYGVEVGPGRRSRSSSRHGMHPGGSTIDQR